MHLNYLQIIFLFKICTLSLLTMTEIYCCSFNIFVIKQLSKIKSLPTSYLALFHR